MHEPLRRGAQSSLPMRLREFLTEVRAFGHVLPIAFVAARPGAAPLLDPRDLPCARVAQAKACMIRADFRTIRRVDSVQRALGGQASPLLNVGADGFEGEIRPLAKQ